MPVVLDEKKWELWYATPGVTGSRIIFKADCRDNVIQTARCELLMLGIEFDWAFVEYCGYFPPSMRRKTL